MPMRGPGGTEEAAQRGRCSHVAGTRLWGSSKGLWLLLGEELAGTEGRAPSLSSLPNPQDMEKVVVPSVTLIVGCGVSSLTLLMLIIIYVSVWRWCPRRVAGGGGQRGSRRGGWPGRVSPGHISFLQPQCFPAPAPRWPPRFLLPSECSPHPAPRCPEGALNLRGPSVSWPLCRSCRLDLQDHASQSEEGRRLGASPQSPPRRLGPGAGGGGGLLSELVTVCVQVRV